MNERMKDLMNQTGVPVSMPFDKWCEKFAELIVQECMSLCQECIDDGCIEAEEPMRKIKQHFRVE